jgi:hypothetical protein
MTGTFHLNLGPGRGENRRKVEPTPNSKWLRDPDARSASSRQAWDHHIPDDAFAPKNGFVQAEKQDLLFLAGVAITMLGATAAALLLA